MRRYTTIAILAVTLAVAAIACSGSPASQPAPTEDPGAGAKPEPTSGLPSGKGQVTVPAPIESAEIEVSGSGAELVLISGLEDSCQEAGDHSLAREGNLIRVEVTNLKPTAPEVACADVYRPVELRISLGADVEPCATYTVEANGKLHRVRAIWPGVSCAAPEPSPVSSPEPFEGMVPVLAPIDGVDLEIAESAQPQYSLVVRSGLPNGCMRFDGYSVDRVDPIIKVTVTNLKPVDKNVFCTQVYGTVETRVPLGSDLEPGTEYTAQVNDVTYTFVTQGEADPAPALDLPFELELNQTAVLDSEALEIRFEAVLEDSRCPAKVVCIWAGRATILLTVLDRSSGEDPRPHELTLEEGNSDLATGNVGRYAVTLMGLFPYPGTPEPEGSDEYTAELLVSVGVSDSPQGYGPVEVILRAEAGRGRKADAALQGGHHRGPDNSKDLYCQGVSWEFGDGTAMAMMPACLPWTSSARFPRHFEETYTHKAAGTYRVTFTYGPLPPETITVEVR